MVVYPGTKSAPGPFRVCSGYAQASILQSYHDDTFVCTKELDPD